MANRSISMTDEIYDYISATLLREPPLLAELRKETATLPRSGMQIGPEQGQFMALLVELLDVRRAIEVGTFTGYSSLAVALAIPPEGRLITCDIDETTTAIARRYWIRAGVADRIDLRLGPAVATLDGLIAEGRRDSFDLAFIDADKPNYENYYERILTLLRPGGLLLVDNVLWDGAVADKTKTDADTSAIRALNARAAADRRVSISIVPIGDGVLMVRKR